MKRLLFAVIPACLIIALLFPSCEPGGRIPSSEVNSESEISSEPDTLNESRETSSVSSTPAEDVQTIENLSSMTKESSSMEAVRVSSKPPADSTPASSSAAENTLPGSVSLKKGMTSAEYAEAYAIAEAIVNRHKDEDEVDMLCRIAEDIYNIYKSGVHSEKDPHYSDVYGVFVLKRASCAGVTRAVCLCMTILGKPYEHVNENKWTHQWCRVFIESENSYCVVDAQGGFVGIEPAPYKHPLI